MRRPRRELVIHAAVAVAAAIAIGLALRALVVPDDGALELVVAGREVTLLQPGWLYLAALLPWFFVVSGESLADVPRAQRAFATAWRSAIVLAIAVALARPVTTAHDDRVATVVLVDVSDSITDAQLDAARAYVAELAAARRGRDRLDVVTFAEKPRLVRPGPDGGVPAIERPAGGRAGSDLQAAMQLAYGILPDGYLPHVAIVSDGIETRGDLLAEAYRAAELGVRVSWRGFPAAAAPEVRLVSLRLPDEIKVGAPFEVKAEIWSNVDGEVAVALTHDDFPNAPEAKKTATLRPGTTWVAFRSDAKQAGHTTYAARLIAPPRDTEAANNAAVLSAPVKGKPRVLYIEGAYRQAPGEAGHLERALEQEDIDVEVRGPGGLPAAAAELARYDLVFVSDVAAEFLGLGQMRALEAYVRDVGGGLIMAGGEDAFGSGGHQGTPIEKLMPVRFDAERRLDQAHVAIALVIDRSGSMQGAKLEAAKESARATAEVLNPTDQITVIAFDTGVGYVVRLQRASNRLRISSDIARLTAGGGTNIGPALAEAFQVLQGANAKVKHVILLSDGQAPYDGIADLCQEMRSSRITVSAVGIGDADRNLLSIIADNGGGRIYMTEDLSELPRIFMKETTEAQRSTLIEDTVGVRVVKDVEMIENTGVRAAPPLRGYVSTKPKPTGEVVLATATGEPLLARWRVGAGTAVAWTSDVKSRWSADWIRWNGYPKFWAQVVRSTMRRKVYDSYDLSTTVSDGRARVVVDAIDVADRFVNQLDTTLEVVDPRDGKIRRTVAMPQTASGRYAADFAIDRYGSFLLKAVHRRGGQIVAESQGAAALPYPPEYVRTTPDEALLARVAAATGGHSQATAASLFAPTTSIPHTRDLWPYLLLAAALALVLDTYLKRVRFALPPRRRN